MTPVDPRPHDEWRALAAAYAIDALDADERQAFDAHRATCAECRALVESYSPAVAGLGLAVDAEQPPASLRARTIARAAAQPQPARGEAPIPGIRLPQSRAVPVPAARRAPSWWMVGAGLAAALALGVYSLSLRQQLTVLRDLVAQASAEVQAVRAELASVRRDSSHLATVLNVLSAADVHRVDLAGQDRARGATARAYVSQSRGLMFSADHLPALAAGHVYQLWVLKGQTPVSAGVLTPARDGSASATMPMPNDVTPASITAVAVTDEPSPQGSPTPTMPILLVGNAGNR
jgi:anti-sigma-K factor RskA